MSNVNVLDCEYIASVFTCCFATTDFAFRLDVVLVSHSTTCKHIISKLAIPSLVGSDAQSDYTQQK